MKKPVLLLLICCLAAPLGGWLAGRRLQAAFASGADVSQEKPPPVRPQPVRKTTVTRDQADAEKEARAIALKKGPGRAAEALAFCARRGAAGLAAMLKAAHRDRALMGFVMNVWNEQDPHTLLQVMAEADFLPYDHYLAYQQIELTERLARQDINRALETAAGIKNPLRRRYTTGRMISAYFQEDAQKALELAKAQNIPIDSNMDLNEVKLTPEMIPQLAALPRSMTQTELLLWAMNTVSREEAWEHAENLNGFMRRRVQGELSQQWAKADLQAVMERAADKSQPSATRAVLHQGIIAELQKTDPAAAASWAEENLSGYYKMKTLREAADALEKQAPEKAAALRAKLPEAFKPSAE